MKKKYWTTNILFTFAFLTFISPLSYWLYDHVKNDHLLYETVMAEQLYEKEKKEILTNRDFSQEKEFAERVPVLMYHQIIPEDKLKPHHYSEDGTLSDTIVTLEAFKKQMDYLKKNDYTVLSLKEFTLYMMNGKKVPAKSVLITFDDGIKNVFKFAYPVLKEHGFYAVHFLITGVITEKTERYNPYSFQYASGKELRESADVFDYGNHTHNFHQRNEKGVPFLKAYDKEAVKKDIKKADDWLGHSSVFAAPYGQYNQETLEILKELNIIMAFTVHSGYADPSVPLLEIPRQNVHNDYSIEDFRRILGE